MPTDEMNQITQEEWRALGFFYDFDKNDSCWLLIGSRSGLHKFCDILNAFANDPSNEQISEHKHYGPYWYLKLMTWEEAEITEQAICGMPSDFKRLAEIIGRKLDSCVAGNKFSIGNEYAEGSKTILEFEVQEEEFDPSSADPLLQSTI